ncbi:MAG TPA: hypothetical protein VFD35_10560 [Pricia sp.]|nr:hypothetical protein [Pricia sp.]
MERILIDVDSEIAKKWQNFSPKLRASLERSFERQSNEVARQSKIVSFDTLLKSISDEAKVNGPTEEILQEILNADD